MDENNCACGRACVEACMYYSWLRWHIDGKVYMCVCVWDKLQRSAFTSRATVSSCMLKRRLREYMMNRWRQGAPWGPREGGRAQAKPGTRYRLSAGTPTRLDWLADYCPLEIHEEENSRKLKSWTTGAPTCRRVVVTAASTSTKSHWDAGSGHRRHQPCVCVCVCASACVFLFVCVNSDGCPSLSVNLLAVCLHQK